MRFVVAHPGPDFSVADVYEGWVEALVAAGHSVVPYNLNDRLTFYDRAYLQVEDEVFRKALDPDRAQERAVDGLYSSLYRHVPDVLLIISAFLIPTDLMDIARRRGTRVVIIHTESPYEDDKQLARAGHADLNLVNDPTNLARFQQVAPTVYCSQAYRPRLHSPGPARPEYRSDFAFVGTGFASRIALFEQMDLGGIDVLLAGNWNRLDPGSPLVKLIATEPEECLDNAQTVEVYRGAKVGLNYYRRESEHDEAHVAGWSIGPREVEMAACGLFFLRDPRPEGDALFPTLPTFTSPAEASEQLRWWLDHPDLRRRAADAAREAAADRTFDSNVRLLIRQLEGI